MPKIVETSAKIGKNPDLSREVRAKIEVLRQANNWSGHRIARELQLSPRTVNNFLRSPDRSGSRARCGRQSIITESMRRRIVYLASRRKMTAGQIHGHTRYTISVRSIQRVLEKDPIFSGRKWPKKPPLTQQHRQARLKFALDHVAWTNEWRNVIFTDEKKFNLDGPDGLHHYWHDLWEEKQVVSRRAFGGGSVMVWAGFGYFGKTAIVILDGRQNSTKYQDTLGNHLLPVALLITEDNWILQQDNAPCHVSADTCRWFEANDVTLLSWPSRSPDLNPIENLWGWLARRVYRNGRQFNDRGQLQLAIKEGWNEIPDALLQSLVASMAERMKAVLIANGGPTKY